MADVFAAVVVSLLQFTFLNWVGSRSAPFGYSTMALLDVGDNAPAFNFVYRTLGPQVILLIAAAALFALWPEVERERLWCATAGSFVLRAGFNVIRGRAFLLLWGRQFIRAVVATGLSFLLCKFVLIDPSRFIPDPRDLATELWLIVVVFIYATLNQPVVGDDKAVKRRTSFVLYRYAVLKQEYVSVVRRNVSHPWVEPLVFAVMIVETFNRPRVVQLLERFVLFPLGCASTLGPMQVTTSRVISDVESVELGARRLDALFASERARLSEAHSWEGGSSAETSGSDLVYLLRGVVVKYNPDGAYAGEVLSVLSEISSRFHPELPKLDVVGLV